MISHSRSLLDFFVGFFVLVYFSHVPFLDRNSSRQPHGEETLRLSLPAPELELGTPPRLCYPLVIFLTRRDNRDPHPDETVSNFFTTSCTFFLKKKKKKPKLVSLILSLLIISHNNVDLCFQVALVNVVHIKDSVCTLPTSILAQYLKQANGQLSCLKVNANFDRKILSLIRGIEFPELSVEDARHLYIPIFALAIIIFQKWLR